MGATLFRYLFTSQLAAIGWLLLGVVALIAMIDLTETTSRFGDVPGFTVPRALIIVALHVPPLLEQVLPFAVLLASMIVLVRLNRRYELVVARSVGVSAWQFLAPVASASLLVGIVSLFTLNPLAAATLRWEEALTAEMFGASAPAGEDRVWLRQAGEDGRYVIAAQSALPGGRGLRGVTFYEIDARGAMASRIDAPLARLNDGAWVLNAATRTRAGAPPESVLRLTIPTPIIPQTVAQRATAPEATAFPALPARIDELSRLGLPTAPFSMQLHSLLTRPVLFVAMTLIAGTVSLRFARFGQARTVVLGGLGAAFALYVATVLVRAFGSAGMVAPVVAAWMPVLAALLLGTAILLRTEDG